MTNTEIKLPAHLKQIVDSIEAKEKEFGITNLATVINNIKKPCDFHPIHAMFRGN